MVWNDAADIYIMQSAGGLNSCVGYWQRRDSGDITADSEWVHVTSNAVLRLQNKATEYSSWGIYAIDTSVYADGREFLAYATEGGSYATSDLPDPFTMTYSAQLYSIMPQDKLTGVHGTSGYSPAEEVTSGLTIAGNAPEIGKIYNANATVKAGALYPA